MADWRVTDSGVLLTRFCHSSDTATSGRKEMTTYPRYVQGDLKHHRFRDSNSITEKMISWVHVSPGSAETLVKRGGVKIRF